jgi:Fuc2NAc and GlcNAc transferase
MKNYAIKKALVDVPNERSSHSVPVPHGGGIAVAITWFMGISYLYYAAEIDTSLYFALMAGSIISVVSYVDDLYELSAKLRLLVQAMVAFLGLYFLGGFESLNVGLFSVETQSVTNIFAFFMILWFINLYNFLDGIDGYAGSEAVFLGIAGFLLFGGSHFLVLAAAVLGFLVWNWHKAKIFMGDVGSTLLGYNVAIFAIYSANVESSNLWIWMILFGVFWFDATLTLARRYKNREKLSQAHRKHAYQRLTQSGWSHSRVTISAIIVNIVLFCLGYFVSTVWIAFLVAIMVLYCIVRFIDSRMDFERK